MHCELVIMQPPTHQQSPSSDITAYTAQGFLVRQCAHACCCAARFHCQIVETEHLLKALLEQPNGLARRIISKAGSDATRLLDKADAFIRRQPRVTGDTAQQVRRSLV